MQIVTGQHHSELDMDRAEFWNSIAFYNYVQEPLDDVRVRPTKEMWEMAREPFKEVLELLKPTHLLVLGGGLWDNLPLEDGRGPDLVVGDEIRETCIYSYQGGHLIATWVYHPSSPNGASAEKSHPFVKKLLDLEIESRR